MAVYEALLLNTVVPQIQAAQAGDSYVMVVNATTPALRITQTGTGNAISVEDEANPDATPFVVTAGGDVGIGTSSPGTKTQIQGAVSTNSEARFLLKISDTSSVAQGNGGGLIFQGVYTGTTLVDAAGLQAYKANSTDNNYSYGLAFTTRADGGNLTANMRLDASGNLGLGVTPSASWGSSYKVAQIGATQSLALSWEGDISNISTNAVKNASAVWVLQNTSSYKPTLYDQYLGQHRWHYGLAGSAGDNASFTQAMTLDASGNLVVGDTSALAKFDVASANVATDSRGNAFIRTTNAFGTDVGGQLMLGGEYNSGSYYGFGGIAGRKENATAGNVAGYLALITTTSGGTSTERARITSGGYFKASNDGNYVEVTNCHELRTTEDARAVIITSTNASYTSDVVQIRAARNTTNNSFYAIGYYNTGAAAYKFRVADSGDVTNTNGTYGTISDQKMKTDIVDAGSQWADIKALRFRKFKMKNDPSGLVQLGVVAQEVELTSPGLVDEHQDRDAEGNDLGTTTKSVKTSVLLMKAAVALQEAMARIETLEAKIAALEAK